MAPRIIASQPPRIYARTIPRSGRQEGDPIRYPRIPPSSAYGEDNVLQHRDYSVSQFVGSPTSDTGRFDDPEYEDDATVDRPRSFPRTAYFPLTTGRQPSNRRVVQEEFEESEDSGDHSFVSAEEFFSAEEDSPLASRTPLNSYQRPSARSPPPRREANHSYPSRPRNGRGSRGGSHHRGSIPPPREAKAPRSRTLVDRTVYERSTDRQDRPISYVPQPVAPHSHHRAPPPPARTTSPIGQQATRTPVSRTKGKHKDERRNQQVGTGDVSGSALGFSTLPVTISKSKRGKESQKQPVEGRGFEKTQTPRIENPLQQSRNTRQSGRGQGFQPRYHDTEILQASQQSSRESSFQRNSSFEPPSTAPTSAQSSFNPAVPGPSQPECHITASGYYSDAPTEEDEEGWQRLEGISWLSRSREHPPATQPLQQSTGVVVEESNFEDDEEALMEHLREEAERERLRYAFDEQLPLEDQYDISEDFVREMAELDLDSVHAGASQSEPRRPFSKFKYLLQYEVTRVSLALGLSLEECEAQVPGIAENCGQAFHTAKTKKELWDAMKLFRQQLLTEKPMPAPLSEEVWLMLNGPTPWTNDIELTGTGSFNQKAKEFKLDIRLNPPSIKGKGNKFAYRFGSDRFLTIKIPTTSFRVKPKDGGPVETEIRSQMVRWLVANEIRLLSRCWRCFFIKTRSQKKRKETDREDTSPEALNPEKTGASTSEGFLWAYFFAESGIGLGEPSYLEKEQLGFLKDPTTSRDEMIRTDMSRDDLIRWHMPLDKHMNSTFSKIWSRISLGLSTSTPTVTFHPDKVIYVEDILSPESKVDNKRSVMNDGCSVCSPKVMRIIREKLGLEETPTAVQARLGGAKGIWFVDPTADRYSEDVSISVTPSQLKFEPHDTDSDEDTMDWARLTLFVLHYSKEPSPTSLNLQFIPILATQGVPFETFKELLEKHLEEDLEQLLSVAQDRISLRSWLSNHGVMSDRQIYGDIPRQSSGTPQSNEEQISMLLDARFEPLKCGFLMDKLNMIVKQQCNDILDGLRIRVPSSTIVFCIADPTGTLEEGEISLQFSKGFLDTTIQTRLDCIEGEVLVARNPAHLRTDIQKVRAVCPSHSGLRRLKDVVVFSTKGNIPLADMLSGGDYDGDKIWICWDNRLVKPFKNDRSFMASKIWKADRWVELIDPKSRFLRDFAQDPSSAPFFQMFFTRGFTSSLTQDYLGMCTDILTRYRYNNHANGKDTNYMTIMNLANLCGVLVDAPKQGVQLSAASLTKLMELNKKLDRKPAYKYPKDRNIHPTGNPEELFILDRLVIGVGINKVAEKMREFAILMDRLGTWTDSHLTSRFHEFDRQADREASPGLRRVRAQLTKDLQELQDIWRRRIQPQLRDPETYSFRAEVEEIYTTFLDIKPPQETLHNPLIRSWYDNADRPNSEWRLLKASMLFYMTKNKQKLPWWITMPELCRMKAEGTAIELRRPSPRTVADDMYLVLKPITKRVSDNNDDDVDE